jgi:hypothetical protein
MTKMAIKAGHLAKEELEDWPTMMRRTTENWMFKPRLRRKKKKWTKQFQRLNNIIWMMCFNHVSDRVAKYAVFGRSPGSKIVFHYLNLKSVILWQMWGIGGWFETASQKNVWIVSYPLAAVKMFLRGNWKELAYKINKKTIKPIKMYVNSRNVGN